MKTKLNSDSDDGLPLRETINLYNIRIVVRSVFIAAANTFPIFSKMTVSTN